MRLIDADNLIHFYFDDEDGNKTFEFVPYEFIETAPTIDAVEVVRCRECKHGKYEFFDNKDWIYCKHHYDYWMADDFCSYGERKGEL